MCSRSANVSVGHARKVSVELDGDEATYFRRFQTPSELVKIVMRVEFEVDAVLGLVYRAYDLIHRLFRLAIVPQDVICRALGRLRSVNHATFSQRERDAP